jgi:hypothetical protein
MSSHASRGSTITYQHSRVLRFGDDLLTQIMFGVTISSRHAEDKRQWQRRKKRGSSVSDDKRGRCSGRGDAVCWRDSDGDEKYVSDDVDSKQF